MARSIPFHCSSSAVRAGQAKALQLPLPRATADALSLRYHIALEAMRTGNGYPAAVHTLTAMMLLTQFLAGAGYGRISSEARIESERSITDAFNTGNEQGEWMFDDVGYAHFAAIVSVHDFQLYSAPMSAIIAAGERLDRLKLDELSCACAQRRA